jgi:hypothetical protein
MNKRENIDSVMNFAISVMRLKNDLISKMLQLNQNARHTRREAGIQCHGW